MISASNSSGLIFSDRDPKRQRLRTWIWCSRFKRICSRSWILAVASMTLASAVWICASAWEDLASAVRILASAWKARSWAWAKVWRSCAISSALDSCFTSGAFPENSGSRYTHKPPSPSPYSGGLGRPGFAPASVPPRSSCSPHSNCRGSGSGPRSSPPTQSGAHTWPANP
jgi:hypothetical protein